MRSVFALVLMTPMVLGCVAEPESSEPTDPVGDEEVSTASTIQALSPALAHGRDVWFENTYGGEKFFTFLANHPDPAKRIKIGFENVIATPRAQRFDVWGVINDPDCEANPSGGPDVCADPESSGVLGIRKKPGPGGTVQYGATCASCHAGFDPLRPPVDPNEPTWDNVHATIGNQYIRFSDIFAVNLPAADPRRVMFAAWPPGSVDTTLLFNDGIMNPGVVTHFWEHPNRPTFDVGMDEEKMRNGQGGEDDVGGDVAALRVFTNIGVCFMECVAPAAATGQPIDVEACYQTCPDFPPQSDLDDLSAFLASFKAPQSPGFAIPILYQLGRLQFDRNCAGCHDRSGKRKHVLSDDEMQFLGDDPANDTNACRALTTNWDAGKLWAEFSSDNFKARAAAGDKGYRNMPLGGIWATSPFLHNQSIGSMPPAEASPWERGQYYWDAMAELLSAERDPLVYTTPVAIGPFPAGTPLQYIFSRAPDGTVLCTDVVENRGHYYGSNLDPLSKVAITHWLQLQ